MVSFTNCKEPLNNFGALHCGPAHLTMIVGFGFLVIGFFILNLYFLAKQRERYSRLVARILRGIHQAEDERNEREDEDRADALKDVELMIRDLRLHEALGDAGGGQFSVTGASAYAELADGDGGDLGQFPMPVASPVAVDLERGLGGRFTDFLTPAQMDLSLDQMDGIEMGDLAPRFEVKDQRGQDLGDRLYIDITDVPPRFLPAVNRLLATAELGQLSYKNPTNDDGHIRHDNA